MSESTQTLTFLAASLAKGRYIGRISALCENQKTVSTKKLQRIIEDIEDVQRLDAINLKKVIDQLRKPVTQK
jgi:hypothetical protein